MLYNTIQNNVIQYDTNNVVQYDTKQCYTIRYKTMWFWTKQKNRYDKNNSMQNNEIQYTTMRYTEGQNNTIKKWNET